MMQDWPVVINTPLRDRFLQDLIRLKYPDMGEQYVQLLVQQPQLDALKGIVGRLSTVLAGAFQQAPELLTALPPEQQADMQQLVAQSQQIAQSSQQTQQPTAQV